LVNGAASITAADINNGSTDNCGIQSIVASKTNFTCSDAGDNTVTLTVTDIHGNINTCNATVTVEGEVPTCSIASVPENNVYTGGVATNIYLGYGPQKTTLQVSAPLSGAPYTYAWSGNGVLSNTNTANPVFAPTAEGTYIFTVEVTNKYGCKTTCNITIHVYDIRVPGSKGKKVYLCHTPDGNPANKQTLSLNISSVPTHLSSHSNDKLGKCDLVIATTMRNDLVINNEMAIIKINTFPNPNKGSFQLLLNNFKAGKLDIRIFNYNGAEVNRRSVIANGTEQLIRYNLGKLASGVYYVQIATKEGLQTSKFVIKR
jgi:PKD repeat protein